METLQLKIYPETKALYEKLKEEQDNINTADQFMRLLLENLQNPRKDKPRPEDLATIKDLTETFEALQDQNAALREQLNAMTVMAEDLQQAVEKNTVPEDAILVTLDPMEKHVLDLMVKVESHNTGKVVTPAELLIRLFDAQVIEGPGDWLPRRFSTAQLKKIQDELKAKAGE